MKLNSHLTAWWNHYESFRKENPNLDSLKRIKINPMLGLTKEKRESYGTKIIQKKNETYKALLEKY